MWILAKSNDPEFLDRIKDKAVTFQLEDGETRTLDLKLAASQPASH